MTNSIEFLQFFRKCHQTIGICPPQPNQKPCLINWTKTILLISCVQVMFTTVAFLAFEAKSMFDYGFAFYVLISIINSMAIYLIFTWQSRNTFEFIGNCEQFIEKSKWMVLFEAFVRRRIRKFRNYCKYILLLSCMITVFEPILISIVLYHISIDISSFLFIRQEFNQRPLMKNSLEKLNCSIVLSATPYISHTYWYFWWPPHAPSSDTTFLIWERVHFTCLLIVGSYFVAKWIAWIQQLQ